MEIVFLDYLFATYFVPMPRFPFSDMFVFALNVLIFLVCCNYIIVQGTIQEFDTTLPNFA
jgi:hypothetical protein